MNRRKFLGLFGVGLGATVVPINAHVAAAAPALPPAVPETVNIQLHGDRFTGEQVRALIQQVNACHGCCHCPRHQTVIYGGGGGGGGGGYTCTHCGAIISWGGGGGGYGPAGGWPASGPR